MLQLRALNVPQELQAGNRNQNLKPPSLLVFTSIFNEYEADLYKRTFRTKSFISTLLSGLLNLVHIPENLTIEIQAPPPSECKILLLLQYSGELYIRSEARIFEVEVTLRLTVSQSISMSWYRAPLWDLRPDITSCRNVAV
jgi:hypothetical protein